MTRTIAITTPAGNVGSKIAARLLSLASEHDLEVVLLARTPEHVADFVQQGARIEQGTLDDADHLVRATRGVDVLYLATPNGFAPEVPLRVGYRNNGYAAAAAIRANRIPHVVHLSGFVGIDDGAGEGSMIGGLTDIEAILDEAVDETRRLHPGSAPAITHLRPGFFFENFLGQVDSIGTQGRFVLPVTDGPRIPMVATRDIAEAAIEAVLGEVPDGHAIRGVHGPRDLSFADAAQALSAGLGRTVELVTAPASAVREAMLAGGRPARLVDAFLAVFDTIMRGELVARPGRDERSTTSTSLETFARDVIEPIASGSWPAKACPALVQ